jgi:hypothetical protein
VVQRGHDLRHIHFQQRGVSAHKPPDVNRRREYVKVSGFQRTDVVGPDFGGFCDLVYGQFPRFAHGAELFGNRWHVGHF